MTVKDLINDNNFINSNTIFFISYNGENKGHNYDDCIIELHEKKILAFKYDSVNNIVYIDLAK